MAGENEFDPYRKWLGIAPGKRPPTHYDLLGISLDEDDPEVIDAAAKRQIAFVKSQLGKGHDDHVSALSYQIQEAHSRSRISKPVAITTSG